jgi:membrane-associated phospholipid phosphatase
VNTLFYVTLGGIVIAGLVMSSRLQLDAHSPREVMVGSIVGLATSVTGMLILF